MKQFIRQILTQAASMLLVLFLLIAALSLALSALQTTEKPKLTANSVLRIKLRGNLVEWNPRKDIPLLKQTNEDINLATLKQAIRMAKDDKKIKGIYLRVEGIRAGWACLKEIRAVLLDFKETGKFVVAYGDAYVPKTYYVAALSDDIFLHPEGDFQFKGLNVVVTFYQGLLEKLSVIPQVLRVGKYKSFVEPFLRQNMSPANRRQRTALLERVYSHFLHTVGKDRSLMPSLLRKKADDLSIAIPTNAYKARLVSHLGYHSDVEQSIRARLRLQPDVAIDYVDFGRYVALHRAPKERKDKIAIVVAEGYIEHGKGRIGNIGSKPFVKTLRALREDQSIKGVVLRINSPGGSALASDTMWQEIKRLREKKPVVASMSDAAASGGYYLAAPCNHIVAQPTTITGSIGIWGLFFDIHALLNRVGVTTDVVKTNVSADLLINPGRPTSQREKTALQKIIEKKYNTFIARVAEGRNMSRATVENVAAGRVWTGSQAKERGLVDTLGGLEDAIEVVAKLAKLEKKYTVTFRPKPKTLLEQILSTEWNDMMAQWIGATSLQEQYPALKHLVTLSNLQGVQARLPYAIEIE